MKRSLLIAIVLCLAGTACKEQPAAITEVSTTLPPVPTTTLLTAPVQLSGLVNLKGVKDFSGVGTNIAVEFTLEDFSFNPTFIKVLPSSRVTYKLENLGKAEHTFTIDSLNVDQVIPVAGVVEGQLQLPESGVIQFHCRFHQGQGMQGAFYFVAGAVAAEATPSPSPSGSGSGTGTKTGAKTTVRRATASRSGAATTRAPQAGDLVIPDVNPGATTVGGGIGGATTKPVAAVATTRRVVTTTRKPGSTTKAPPAATGAPGKTSPNGSAGTTGAQGNEGGTGAPGNTSPPFTGTFPTFN